MDFLSHFSQKSCENDIYLSDSDLADHPLNNIIIPDTPGIYKFLVGQKIKKKVQAKKLVKMNKFHGNFFFFLNISYF